MSKILDAIKDLGDNPSHSEVSALALVSIASGLERIVDTLEKRPSSVTNVYAPNREIKLRAESPDGKVKSEAVVPAPPGKFERTNPWIKWNGQDRGPWKNLDPMSTVRVQFRSKPDHIETYRLDSSEIDWSDVMAYQIVNRSE